MELDVLIHPAAPDYKKAHIRFEVYDNHLENLRVDSADNSYFGYPTLEALQNVKDYGLYQQILINYPYALQLLDGGRIDILLRTPEKVRMRMNGLVVQDGKDKTLFWHVYHCLLNVSVEDYPDIEEIFSLDTAIDILEDRHNS